MIQVISLEDGEYDMTVMDAMGAARAIMTGNFVEVYISAVPKDVPDIGLIFRERRYLFYGLGHDSIIEIWKDLVERELSLGELRDAIARSEEFVLAEFNLPT